jgi:hypothetical protein
VQREGGGRPRLRAARGECRPVDPRDLSGPFAAAARWERIDESPADRAKLSRANAVEPEPPSSADVAALLRTASELDVPLALFLWLAVTAPEQAQDALLVDVGRVRHLAEAASGT